MADKIITIDLDPETETMSVDTAGFNGEGCGAIHEAFKAMGTVTKAVIQPEYYRRNQNQNTVRAGR